MARTTAADVKEILDNCNKTDDQIEPFITSANLFITDVFSSNTTIGDSLLTELEKWLAAHMVSTTIWRTASDEKVGDVSVKYTGTWGEMLKSTSYGQMVLMLDTTGEIASTGKERSTTYAIISFD